MERLLVFPHALQQLLRSLGDIPSAAMTNAQAQDLSAAAMLACKLRNRLPHEGGRRSPDLPADRLEAAVITFIEIDGRLLGSYTATIYASLPEVKRPHPEPFLNNVPGTSRVKRRSPAGGRRVMLTSRHQIVYDLMRENDLDPRR